MASIRGFLGISAFARRRTSRGRRRAGLLDAPRGCEALEVRVVMSAAPVIVAPATDNSAADFTTSLWNGGIAISAYAGPGGIVRIPATIDGLPVTTILGLGLAGRPDVTGVVLPAGVTAIYPASFAGSGITSIVIPAGVTFMDQAFIGADRLQSIEVDAANPAFTSVGGVLFSRDGTVLCEYPAGRAGGYDVPVGVEFMRPYAFANRNRLTAVTLPATLRFVPEYGFAFCSALRSVRLAAGVGGIAQFAFRSCRSLTTVSLPASTESIGFGAFYKCPKLRAIDGPATAPLQLQATLRAPRRIELRWQRPALADETILVVRHYRIEASPDLGKTWRRAAEVPADATQLTITGPRAARWIMFRVTPMLEIPATELFDASATLRGSAATTTISLHARGWLRRV